VSQSEEQSSDYGRDTGVVLKLDSWFATNAAREGLIDRPLIDGDTVAASGGLRPSDLWSAQELELKC
jgi:hypothetical protein